ncbi:MAG: hypothetical protein PHX62_00110 [Bacilli bacterium]|nr:hypothetical protein [Bacilli bacterium]
MEIDVYKGNENIFLILTGIGGSTKGFQNKYVNLSRKINEKYGFTAFVVSTESGVWNDERKYFDKVINEVSSYINMMKINVKKIFAMGTSAGANLLIHNAHRYNAIKKILAINFLFNVNYNLFQDFIKEYEGMATLIVGERDSSYTFFDILNKYKSERIRVISIPNADHNFADMLNTYLELPEKYLFKDDMK